MAKKHVVVPVVAAIPCARCATDLTEAEARRVGHICQTCRSAAQAARKAAKLADAPEPETEVEAEAEVEVEAEVVVAQVAKVKRNGSGGANGHQPTEDTVPYTPDVVDQILATNAQQADRIVALESYYAVVTGRILALAGTAWAERRQIEPEELRDALIAAEADAEAEAEVS